jgi:hypothetical protein
MDVFLHIPKASGTTVRTIISREYGFASTFYYEPESALFPDRKTPEAYLRSRVNQGGVRLITGHMRYGVHRALHQPCRYFTILRDPIDRTLSDYFYAHVYPLHRFREEIVSGSMSFADFLSVQGVSPALAMTYFLAGEFEGLNDPLEAALFNVKNCFVSVGTSERFDESILLIARDLGWRPPLYLRRNVARLDNGVRDHRRQVDEEARGSLSSYFGSDYEVYTAADELLSDRVHELGERFQKALEDYQELQEALARLDTGSTSDTYTLDQDAPLPAAAADLLESAPYRALAEYLIEAPAKDTDRSNLVGFLEARSATGVGGWAMDLSRSEPMKVTVYKSGRPIATVTCDRQRPDVAAAGYPSDICGFNLQLDAPVDDPEELLVCFADTPVQLTATGAARKSRN